MFLINTKNEIQQLNKIRKKNNSFLLFFKFKEMLNVYHSMMQLKIIIFLVQIVLNIF